MTDFFSSKVTIYNDIPATAVLPRRFERFVIKKCNIQSGRVSKADGTIENIVNATTVITKDVAHYRNFDKYINIPLDIREQLFTVHIGDFVVLDEVDDVVENSQHWQQLQRKYENKGFKVTSVSPNINGMSVDNVSFTNV